MPSVARYNMMAHILTTML